MNHLTATFKCYTETKKVFQKYPPGKYQGVARFERGCFFRDPSPYAKDRRYRPERSIRIFIF